MSESIKAVVHDIVPVMLADIAHEMGLPPSSNIAQSNQCHVLTESLLGALQARNLPVRREYHMNNHGDWHFLIAHHRPDETPTSTDIVTDLNPWQFWPGRTDKEYVHMTRNNLQDLLRDHGAPESFISLRSIATIVEAHVQRGNQGKRTG